MGFAYDGYPIYGPYNSPGVVAVSCWQKRDYSASSPTGCSSGTRSCVLVDEFNYTKGTTPTVSGPGFTANLLTQAGNPTLGKVGIFYEDYFYNASCAAQGGQYLNQYNGHDHDGLGFHYHTTMDFVPTFPYTVGPKYYGCLQGGGLCPAHATSTSSDEAISQCAASTALPISSQRCLDQQFKMSRKTNSSTNSTSTASSSSSSDPPPLPITAVIGIVVGGGVVAAVLFSMFMFHSSKSAMIYAVTDAALPTVVPASLPTAELMDVPIATVVRYNRGVQY